jgi:hypothetical protein
MIERATFARGGIESPLAAVVPEVMSRCERLSPRQAPAAIHFTEGIDRGAMASRRATHSTRLTHETPFARARRDLEAQLRRDEAQFEREIAVLHEQLAHMPRRRQARDQLIHQLLVQLAAIVHRAADRQLALWFESAREGRTRGPGRPRTRPIDARSILGGWRPATRGRPKVHDIDDAWIVALVDDWKARAARERGLRLADRRAVAELLFAYAPGPIRATLEVCRARYQRSAETRFARAYALTQAVAKHEGPRLEWWVKRLDRARRTLRR